MVRLAVALHKEPDPGDYVGLCLEDLTAIRCIGR